MRAELKIFDKEPGTGNIVIGLPPLFGALLGFAPEALDWRWLLWRGAYGYGEYVGELERRAGEGDGVIVSLSEVLTHLERGEYFEHAEFVAPDTGVEVARIDSAFLLLRGSEDLVRFCASRFDQTEIELLPEFVES